MSRRTLRSATATDEPQHLSPTPAGSVAPAQARLCSILSRAIAELSALAREVGGDAGCRANGLADLAEPEAHGVRAARRERAQPSPMNNNLMTAEEVAEVLRIDVRTLRRRRHLEE